MALNAFQYESLFTNAFGASTEEFGVTIDTSGPDAVGTHGAHTIDLLVIVDRPLEWRVDGAHLIKWEKVYTKDDPARARNADALRAKLV
jgi:hypothetical protein